MLSSVNKPLFDPRGRFPGYLHRPLHLLALLLAVRTLAEQAGTCCCTRAQRFDHSSSRPRNQVGGAEEMSE
jgi:hypothetical protein